EGDKGQRLLRSLLPAPGLLRAGRLALGPVDPGHLAGREHLGPRRLEAGLGPLHADPRGEVDLSASVLPTLVSGRGLAGRRACPHGARRLGPRARRRTAAACLPASAPPGARCSSPPPGPGGGGGGGGRTLP